MRVDIKLSGIEGVLDTLKALPPEVVSKRGGVVRASLRKGAMVIVNQAKPNFRAAVQAPGKSGITRTTGFTEKNIVAIRKRPLGGVKGERFIVSVRTVLHPGGTQFKRKTRRAADSKKRRRKISGSAMRANDIAFVMEHGSSKQPAIPWLRPAFKSKAQEAINVTTTDLKRRIDVAVKKLAAQNRGK